MAKRQVKGKVGSVAQYLSRAQALKRLQLPLADFRKLCIIRGIYPRAPQTKLQGSDKIYYHVRDIRVLATDMLKERLYLIERNRKRVLKEKSKGNIAKARYLEYELRGEKDYGRVILERYPSFESALNDLDDCLNTLALLSAAQSFTGLDPCLIAECSNAYHTFICYATKSAAFSKAFASIKGYYLQVSLPFNSKVTWLQPHRFSSSVSDAVDLKVIATFSEFYISFLKFVNYKLFLDCGWEIQNNISKISSAEGLFKDAVFFVSREVPRLPFVPLLKSQGAIVLCEGDDVVASSVLSSITHVVVDRPTVRSTVSNREYIQPQYVLDCINESVLLPVKEYCVGVSLPAHLSPFPQNNDYVPKRRLLLDQLKENSGTKAFQESSSTPGDREKSHLLSISVESGYETKLNQPLQLDTETSSSSLLSKKQRRLLERIEKTKSKNQKDAASLRRRAL
jgi:pescadillo